MATRPNKDDMAEMRMKRRLEEGVGGTGELVEAAGVVLLMVEAGVGGFGVMLGQCQCQDELLGGKVLRLKSIQDECLAPIVEAEIHPTRYLTHAARFLQPL